MDTMTTQLPTGISLAPIPLLSPAMPEIILAGLALLLLVIGAFRGARSTLFLSVAALIGLGGVFTMLLCGSQEPIVTFGTLFIMDHFAIVMKILVLGAGALALAMAVPYWRREGFEKPEYPVLVLLSIVGMFAMISANDLLVLYIGLELQNFALYILASFQRDKRQTSEAGLKYFFLGALSSGIILYGMSLIYGYAGSTSYLTLAQSLADPSALQPGLVVGLVMTLCGVAFKVSAAPFHMWTPDVYEGAPTPVTALFAMAPKVAAFGMIIRLLYGPLAGVVLQWQQVLMAMAFLSILIGAFAGLRQTNLKRLMAYSSIGHVGFIMMSLASGNIQGMQMAIAYLVVYVLMSAGAFAVILSLRHDDAWKEQITDLAGLAKTQPLLALSFMVIIFSMIGLPPLAGFLVKLNVIKIAVEANMVSLAVIAVLASVVSAFYYLRLIKTMYFDEISHTYVLTSRVYTVIAALTALLLLVFFILPRPLYDLASYAVLNIS
jgi:NADH-quinone oxidoreductase subunit N